MDKILKKDLNSNDQFEIFAGLIGHEGATAFAKFLENSEKPISLADIFKYTKKTKKRVLNCIEKNRVDILHQANKYITDFFNTEEELTDKAGLNLMTYMEDLPLSIMFDLAYNIYKDSRFYTFVANNPEKKAIFTKRLQEARNEKGQESEKSTEEK